jgi:hypothetical protein
MPPPSGFCWADFMNSTAGCVGGLITPLAPITSNPLRILSVGLLGALLFWFDLSASGGNTLSEAGRGGQLVAPNAGSSACVFAR